MNSIQRREFSRKVLTSATEVLCENLDPKKVIRKLLSAGVLSDSDVQNIKSNNTTDDSVDALLSILKLKGSRAYDCFMESLGSIDRNLYHQVKQKEAKIFMEGKEIKLLHSTVFHILMKSYFCNIS